MAVAAKKSDEHWAFCRYHLRLTDAEIKRLTPSQFKSLKRLWNDEQVDKIKFFEKLVARVNYMLYLLNVSETKRQIKSADELMYLGNKIESKDADLSTQEGQAELSKMFNRMTGAK